MDSKIKLEIKETTNRGILCFIARLTNVSQNRLNVMMSFSYISKKYGVLGIWSHMQPDLRNVDTLFPNTFVDVSIDFNRVQETKSGNESFVKLKNTDVCEGDRIKIVIPQCFSSLFEKKNGEWTLMESEILEINTSSVKQKIEHFEELEGKLGLIFQNFSIRLKDENTFVLFFESITIDETLCNGMKKIRIRLAIYNTDNDIVRSQGLNIYNADTSIFQIMCFEVRDLEIPIREISKIRVFPVYEL